MTFFQRGRVDVGYHFRVGNGGVHLILDSEQNGGLQTVVLDRVHGAGRPGAVLVSGAGVIDIFPALAAGDGFPAVGAFQKTAEQVNLPPFGGCPGIAYQQGLHLVKGFVGDDSLVGIGDAHPFFLRHRLNLVYLVAFHTAAALYQIPGIDGVGEDFMYHAGSPHGVVRHSRGNGQALFPAVGRGAGYAVFVQIQGDGPFRRALQEHGIHALDGFSRIHNKLVLILRVFDVAIGGERADILAVAPLVIKNLPDFL